MSEPISISTWSFGIIAARAVVKAFREGKSVLDAVIAGAQAVEDDPSVTSVGYGGLGNSIGTVSLDAAVMDGRTLDCGAVAGVENIRHVASLAKLVAEKTPHILLVGKGAEWFALQNGYPLQTLLTPETVALWEKNAHQMKVAEPWTHDTVTVLGRDAQGNLAGACTTSGLSYKLPGRVGDSPIIGSGLYVDNEAGAAGATGVGEEIIRIVGAQFMVEQMRQGKTAQEACELAAKRHHITAKRRGKTPVSVAFIAIDREGSVGAAVTTHSAQFQYAVTRGDQIEMFQGKVVIEG